MAIVTVVLVLIIAVTFVGLSVARTTSRRMTNSTQMRGILQGLFTWSQSKRYPEWYPGCGRDGRIVDDPIVSSSEEYGSSKTGAHPSYRIALLLNGGYFTPDYAINPMDGGVKKPAELGKEVTPDNFSYAMLRLDTEARHGEWKETINADAVVMSDRMVGTLASPQSAWTEPGSGEWTGTVVYNDGRAAFVTDPDPRTGKPAPIVRNTSYAGNATVPIDNLFAPDDADEAGNTEANAAMVFATDSDYENQK